MIFELTDSLCAEILHAMDNQQQTFVLDAEKLKTVQIDCASDFDTVDEENIYSLPLWDSADGYNLLESFINKYKGVKAYGELKQVLAEGRGVFKNFKNTLKKYPEIERRFHSYKTKKMNERIIEWYNALRESWGLENLEQDFDEYDDLVTEDFSFRAYNHLMDSEYVAKEVSAFKEELKHQFAGELGEAMSAFMTGPNFNTECLKNESVSGVVCRTFTDEFAGCILYSYLESLPQKAAFLTALFVNQNYRGLGIAKELLEQCFSSLEKDGIHFFIISNSIVPGMLESHLTRLGFKKNDFAYVGTLN